MKNILDEIMPDHDNDPANYILIRSSLGIYSAYYKPSNVIMDFFAEDEEGMETHNKVRDYLLSQNVEIVEGGLPGFWAKYVTQDKQEDDDSS